MDSSTDKLIISLDNGREIGMIKTKIPLLANATESQLNNFSIIKRNTIHWPDLNQTIPMSKFNKYGVCKLCLNKKLLQKESHIIPKFIFKQSDLIDEHGRVTNVVLDLENHKIKKQVEVPGTGYTVDDILCEDCDQKIIGKYYEDYVAKLIYTNSIENVNNKRIYTNYNNVKVDEFENIDKGKIKLFVLSILWRCSVSKHSDFKDINLGTVYQEKIRKMIYNQDPGNENEFPFAIFTTLKNSNWSEDIVRLPIQERFHIGSYYKMILGGFIFVCNVSLKEINKFFLTDPSKIVIYHLPDHFTLLDFGRPLFLKKIFDFFSGKQS